MHPVQRCQGCGYDLAGSDETASELRCPECGRPYLLGELPNPNWPGWGTVFIEGSGLFLALLAMGVGILFVPAGFPLGIAILLAAAYMGLAGPLLVVRSYAVAFPAHPMRWLSWRRLLILTLGFNSAAGALAWMIVR